MWAGLFTIEPSLRLLQLHETYLHRGSRVADFSQLSLSTPLNSMIEIGRLPHDRKSSILFYSPSHISTLRRQSSEQRIRSDQIKSRHPTSYLGTVGHYHQIAHHNAHIQPVKAALPFNGSNEFHGQRLGVSNPAIDVSSLYPDGSLAAGLSSFGLCYYKFLFWQIPRFVIFHSVQDKHNLKAQPIFGIWPWVYRPEAPCKHHKDDIRRNR